MTSKKHNYLKINNQNHKNDGHQRKHPRERKEAKRQKGHEGLRKAKKPNTL